MSLVTGLLPWCRRRCGKSVCMLTAVCGCYQAVTRVQSSPGESEMRGRGALGWLNSLHIFLFSVRAD